MTSCGRREAAIHQTGDPVAGVSLGAPFYESTIMSYGHRRASTRL